MTYGTDYQEVRHERATAEIGAFFSPSKYNERVFELSQEFDCAGVEGRLLSSSYIPQKSDARYEPMLRELRRIFEKNQAGGRVSLEYKTRVYYGRLE